MKRFIEKILNRFGYIKQDMYIHFPPVPSATTKYYISGVKDEEEQERRVCLNIRKFTQAMEYNPLELSFAKFNIKREMIREMENSICEHVKENIVWIDEDNKISAIIFLGVKGDSQC